MSKTGKTSTYWARIYIAGDVTEAERICRTFVMCGLCVNVTPTNYLYTGGSETGVIVELINYPRFPSSPEDIRNQAENLASSLMFGLCQGSYTIMYPDDTEYFDRRDEFN